MSEHRPTDVNPTSLSEVTQTSLTIGNHAGAWETELTNSLEIFDFSKPLKEKKETDLRIFYNNCNVISINNNNTVFNNLISVHGNDASIPKGNSS